MRLINIKTYQLESFDNWDTVPPYAILSHTWEQEEVLFRDITTDVMKKKQGWAKIIGASIEAEKLGLSYLWVDTCCIDKESSAELSQSINSMFAWYHDARICFAYLEDFPSGVNVSSFDNSRWWTRGWTLQELIAPVEVMFFTQDWSFVGLRSTLAKRIATITGIGEVILAGGKLDKLHDFSVAEKFSWAAKRRTTRGEDRAYSLMGIFGVNMAMIYGEGEKAACYRLQKEIFGVYPDHSIFAWDSAFGDFSGDGLGDLFAPKISAFANSSDIISEPYDWDVIRLPKESKPKAASNKNKQLSTFCSFSHGIRVQMLLESTDSNYFLAYLACRRRGRKRTCHVIWLFLDKRSGQYRRSPSPQNVAEAKINYHTGYKTTLEDVYISQPPSDFAQHQVQYQIRGSYDEPNSEFLLYVEDDLAQAAGFTSVTYVPEAPKPPVGQAGSRARVGIRLWRTDQRNDNGIVYRDENTGELFAILVWSRETHRINPPHNVRFLVNFLTNVGSIHRFSNDLSVDNLVMLSDFERVTDLSKNMMIRPLLSGKQVILGVNTFASGSSLSFRLSVIVKEPMI